jgi:FkbH-like protein
MNSYIFRNYTVEYLFDSNHAFSGYGDINIPSGLFEKYVIFYQVNPSLSPEGQSREIEDIKSKIDFLITRLNSDKRVIIFTLQNVADKRWNLKSDDLANSIAAFNEYLTVLQEKNKNVRILNINSFFESEYQLPTVDWRFFFISQMPINPKLGKAFKNWYNRQLNALDLKRKKCIILDCDNTLWGGIVGEDGVYGVKLGEDYPGICFKRFQELLSKLSEKGVILAIASKNNFNDVEEIWKSNINNIINNKHLSSYRINWEAKASNIKEIAEELNIGLDSLVFIDDNPVERGLVKEFLAEVEVPEFPKQPYELVDFFWRIYNQYFLTYELSHEDLRKTEQYKENAIRNENKRAFKDIDEYLQSLNIQIDIYNADETNISRISQMTQKTNQFNVTTRRYTEDDIRKFIKDESKVFCAGVKDKYGDNGITIAGILKQTAPDRMKIDSYLLSCRILGRNIEQVVLIHMINLLRSEGVSQLNAEFIPTNKNLLASDFFEKIGFNLDNIDKEGIKYYSLHLDSDIKINDYYKIINH